MVVYLFKYMIDSARLKRKQYKPPKRNIVGGLLLEDNFDHVKGNNFTQLQNDSSTYGMTAMGNGAKIINMLLCNLF